MLYISSFNLFSSPACSSSLSFCSFSSMRLTALGYGSCSSSVSSIGYANTMLSFDISSGSFSVTNVSFCFGFEGAGVFLAGTGFFGGINRILKYSHFLILFIVVKCAELF